MHLNAHLKRVLPLLIACLGIAASSPSKEFLTEREIESVQEAQAIEARVKVYMAAAELRLKTAEDRLAGKESEEGDPMEFLSPEDMLNAYYQIIKSVLYNVDDALENPGRRQHNIVKALNILKTETERNLKELMILQRLAEEKKKEDLLNRIDEAIAINDEAHGSALEGLSRLSNKNSR